MKTGFITICRTALGRYLETVDGKGTAAGFTSYVREHHRDSLLVYREKVENAAIGRAWATLTRETEIHDPQLLLFPAFVRRTFTLPAGKGKGFVKKRGLDCSLRELGDHIRVASRSARSDSQALKPLRTLLTKSLALPGATKEWTVRQALEVMHANTKN